MVARHLENDVVAAMGLSSGDPADADMQKNLTRARRLFGDLVIAKGGAASAGGAAGFFGEAGNPGAPGI